MACRWTTKGGMEAQQSGDPWELLKALEGTGFGSVVLVACAPAFLARLMPNQISHMEMSSHAKNVTATISGEVLHASIVALYVAYILFLHLFLFAGDVQWRQEEAARLLTRSALEALDALLEEGKPHVVDFLSDRQVAGEAPVEEFQQTAKLVEEEARATDLFGTLAELLRGSELELSAEGRVRLSVEAVVFGAALFDAEATGSLMRACRNLCQAVVLTLLLRANAISEENEGNLTNATTTTQTTSTTYSVGTRTSSSTTCTWSTLTATATTQTHSTTSSTSTSTTTVHLVTMSGKILVDVSDPQAFSESAEVLIGLGRALHSILKVPMEAIKVTIETRPGSVQAVQYVVTLEGPTATEDMINAKQSLITATPQEIAQLFQQEVNALTSQTHLMMVMEVEPPRIEGIDDRGTTARGGYGMVFDPQVDSAHPLQSTLLAART
eukprot:s2819_g3.t3